VKIGILAYVNENTAPADVVARRCELAMRNSGAYPKMLADERNFIDPGRPVPAKRTGFAHLHLCGAFCSVGALATRDADYDRIPELTVYSPTDLF